MMINESTRKNLCKKKTRKNKKMHAGRRVITPYLYNMNLLLFGLYYFISKTIIVMRKPLLLSLPFQHYYCDTHIILVHQCNRIRVTVSYIIVVFTTFATREKTFSENKTARSHVIIKLLYTSTLVFTYNPIKKMICGGNLFQALENRAHCANILL